jgi:hypothetical protein
VSFDLVGLVVAETTVEVLAEALVGDLADKVGDLTLSILARGEDPDAGDDERGIAPSTTGGVAARRPKNESSPPWPVFFLSATDVSSFLVSTTRHPGGRRSASPTGSGRRLTDASHAVDPLVAL